MDVLRHGVERESKTPTRYAVRCERCQGLIYLTSEFYDWQMDNPDAPWRCPRCLGRAEWDDDNYEREDL